MPLERFGSWDEPPLVVEVVEALAEQKASVHSTDFNPVVHDTNE